MSPFSRRRRLGVLLVCPVLLRFSLSFTSTSTPTHRQSECPRMAAVMPPSHFSPLMSGNIHSEMDRDTVMIKSLAEAMTAQEIDERLRAAHCRNAPDHSGQADLIKLNQTAIEKTLEKFPKFSVDILAAALRRLALISAREGGEQTERDQGRLLESLLETVGHQMLVAQKDHGMLAVYPLADILQALSILSISDVYTDSEHFNALLGQLSESAIEMLSRHDPSELKTLGPIRLVQCLQAMGKLGMTESLLHYRIYEQLLKPNASSRLPAKYLAHGLDAVALIFHNRADDEAVPDANGRDDTKPRELVLFARALMRRLRKQGVRDEATIEILCKALASTDSLWHCGGLKNLEDEAAIFGFTTLRAILKKKHESDIPIAPVHMATMISAWGTLTNNQNEGTVIEDLLEICRNDQILERSSIFELQRIISSIQELRISYQTEALRVGGERFFTLTKSGNISPSAFNAMIRCPLVLHRHNDHVMDPYLRACECVLVNQNFLSRCGLGDVANFLWFSSLARWRHDGVLLSLGRRILDDPRLCDHASPKMACRILATYTSILSLPRKTRTGRDNLSDHVIRELTGELFHSYGGYLLTSQLTPAEVSSALYAYAKVAYSHDMGIFDHLSQLMASFPERATVRQLSSALWSCGKMSAWEQPAMSGAFANPSTGRAATKDEPPYIKSAHKIASALSARADMLTHVDVTQCIWALGRLGVTDDQAVRNFSRRASSLVHRMNAVEISNILWGFSRVNFLDRALLDDLMARLISGDIHVSPKEAAMSLYALGRLGVGDEAVYTELSAVLIATIDDVSAQALANTLWAFRNVHLRPPQELMNLWATHRLGLVSVPMDEIATGEK